MWTENKKACVTTLMLNFNDWINEMFCLSVKIYLSDNQLPLKYLSLPDNAPTHPIGLGDTLLEEFSFITVKFLSLISQHLQSP